MAEKKKSRSEQPNHLKVWRAFGIIAVLAIAVASLNWLKTFGAQRKVPFHIEEATISDIQSALLAKRITSLPYCELPRRTSERRSTVWSLQNLVRSPTGASRGL